MINKAIDRRWRITKFLLRLAQRTMVKDSDYGRKLDKALSDWFHYVKYGIYPRGTE